MASRFLVAALSLPVVASQWWPTQGGSASRVSYATLPINMQSSGSRPPYSYPLKVDRDISTIEGFLLQCALVTTSGWVVLVTDDLDVSVMPDPGTLGAGAKWLPVNTLLHGNMNPLPAIATADMVFAGAYLDNDDILYLVDGRNRAIRAIAISPSAGLAELPNSPFYFNKSQYFFSLIGTVSMSIVEDSGGDQLWIPLTGSLTGSDGVAIVLDTAIFGAAGGMPPVIVPLPANQLACTYPQDMGSATLTGRLRADAGASGAVILGTAACGAVAAHVDMASGTASTMWQSPNGAYLFEREGEHGHPVYDPQSHNLFFVDYSVRYGAPQQLCCQYTVDWGYCNGWKSQCINIPAESYNPDTEIFTEWDWLSMAVSNNVLYIAASGYTTFDAGDTYSLLAAISIPTGVIVAKHRFATDMFNSAPLIIESTGIVAPQRLFLSTTRGGIYCYSADSIASGPVWTTYGEIGSVPDSELPESTFSYLSITKSGTLLVTAPAFGGNWSAEKVVYAITNGVLSPPSSPSPSGLSSAAAAGIGAAAAVVAFAAFGFAYLRMPAFRSTVNGAASSVRGATTSLFKRRQYSGVDRGTGKSTPFGTSSSYGGSDKVASFGATGGGYNSTL